jgi:hypothetical protein
MNIDTFLHKVIDISTAVNGAAWRALGTKTWLSADGRVTPIDKMLPWLQAERNRREHLERERRQEQRLAALEAVAYQHIADVVQRNRYLAERVTTLENNQREQLAPADIAISTRVARCEDRLRVLEAIAVTRGALQRALRGAAAVSGSVVVTAFNRLADEFNK